MYSVKKFKKIAKGLFSKHWYRILRLEVLKRQTDKFRINLLRKKYWIEGFIDDNGKARFHVLRRRTSKRGRARIYQINHTFKSLDKAKCFIFAVTERKLKLSK